MQLSTKFEWIPNNLQLVSSSLTGRFIQINRCSNGTVVNVDMNAQNSYELSNIGINTLLVEYAVALCDSVEVVDDWNIVSVPVLAEDMNKDILFSSSISSAYNFDGVYFKETELLNGKGYWLKFDGEEQFEICGKALSSTIPVNAGWNMIGVYHNDIDVNNIIYSPSGINSSSYFGYDNGYISSTILEAGKGYWIKVSEDGELDIAEQLGQRNSEAFSGNR